MYFSEALLQIADEKAVVNKDTFCKIWDMQMLDPYQHILCIIIKQVTKNILYEKVGGI